MTHPSRPPEALAGPSLCPRCDEPAQRGDRCTACSLELRHCGACQGVAAPFDQYCGYCGYELVLGRRRSFAWRLWLVAALIPLVLGLIYGGLQGRPLASSLSSRRSVATAPLMTSSPFPTGRLLESRKLKFECAPPNSWVVYDYSLLEDPSADQPMVVASAEREDNEPVATAKGDLLAAKPHAAVVVFRWVDSSTPELATLSSDLDQLKAKSSPDMPVSTVVAPSRTTIGGRPAASMLVQLGTSSYFERTYIQPASGSQLFEIDALAPTVTWKDQDARAIDATLHSVRLL